MSFENGVELFDKYAIDDKDIKIGDHFLVDFYANELWEVERTAKKLYDPIRKQAFNLKLINFVCSTKKYGSPNGYWKMELLKELKGEQK